jgi:hypothetical protein
MLSNQLAEHLVFALQAIPAALMPATWVVTLVLCGWYGDILVNRNRQRTLEDVGKMDVAAREVFVSRAKKKLRWIKIVDPFVKGFIIAIAVWQFSIHHYTSALWILISLFLFGISSLSPLERFLEHANF